MIHLRLILLFFFVFYDENVAVLGELLLAIVVDVLKLVLLWML